MERGDHSTFPKVPHTLSQTPSDLRTEDSIGREEMIPGGNYRQKEVHSIRVQLGVPHSFAFFANEWDLS